MAELLCCMTTECARKIADSVFEKHHERIARYGHDSIFVSTVETGSSEPWPMFYVSNESLRCCSRHAPRVEVANRTEEMWRDAKYRIRRHFSIGLTRDTHLQLTMFS